jgi:flagellar biosynthetic protein FlhB
MAETGQDRTEAPTPRRREEARRRGQVARSSDLAPAVILLGAMILLHTSGQQIMGRLMEITRRCLDASGDEALRVSTMTLTLGMTFRQMAALVLPMLLVVFVIALVTCLLQVGFVFSWTPLTPSLDKVNPLHGASRMFSGRSVVHLVLGLAKMLLLALVTWSTVRGHIDLIAGASGLNHLSVVSAAADLIYTLGIRLGIVLLVLALIDYAYQRIRHERDLRMTKEEVREELKRMEGDPLLKRRRREVQRHLLLQRIRSSVPKADVVVTNPTELAIALQYETQTMTAPKVVATGADFLARKIREIAIEHGVPIVERKPLARALYRDVEVGQEIPAKFYKAVAEILAYVYELAGKKHSRRMAVRAN